MLNLPRMNFDLEARLKTLPQPVTLFWSERAVFPPLEWAYRFQAAIEKCSLVILKNVGVLAALEDPRQVSEALKAELRAGLRLYEAS